MNVTDSRLGELNCKVVDQLPEGGSPSTIVIFCHGYGAPGTDLVPLGPEILTTNPQLADSVRFIFPAAPILLESWGSHDSRAWWHIDIERFQSAMLTGSVETLKNDMPDGLPDSREKLLGLISAVQAETGLPTSQFVLGGFSQGSMLATDVALRLDEAPAALCVFSGTLLGADEWRKLAEKRGPLNVFQSHGRQDPILPFMAAEWLRDMLVECGLNVEFLPFNGAHTIGQEAYVRAAHLITQAVDSSMA